MLDLPGMESEPLIHIAEAEPITPAITTEAMVAPVVEPETPTTIKDTTMTEPMNIFTTPNSGMGGAIGGGLGAGLLGGILGGALLGGNGVLGGRNGAVDGIVTPALLATNTNQILDAASATTASNAFRDIQASIERTAAATQTAGLVQTSALGIEVAKGQGELNTQNALNAAATQVLVQKTAGETQTQLALGDARTQSIIAEVGTANALAFKDVEIGNQQTKYELAQAVKADGDLTRAKMEAYELAELNRIITTQANEIIELKGDRHSRDRAAETEVKVTQIVNQNQAQAQQQQQFQVLGTIASGLQALINQNQTIHQGIVNLGTMSGSAGQQTAANTRVQ